MDCQTAREQLDGRPDDAVAAHLRECAACRAEAAFRARLAMAVSAMPRVSAPDTLTARVMAEVALRESREPSWALRTWEIVGLAAACLLLVLVPMALGLVAWSPGAVAAPEALADWIGSARISAEILIQRVTDWIGPGWALRMPPVGIPLVAGIAVATFALALALLLSWRGNGVAPGEERARA
jgi:predicted anti-sigma-YlaC factor YlaD